MPQNSTPISTAVISFANTTRVRSGVTRKVPLAVWCWYSLVISRVPSSSANISPKNCPAV
jgi:hypothetical protein